MGITDYFENKTVFIDTAPLIYYIENNSEYSAVLNDFFKLNKQGKFKLITSSLTLTEVLVQPFRLKRFDLAKLYKSILINSKTIEIVNMDIAVSVKAAKIRAEYNFKTPDAIQLASAIEYSCDIFLTNDKQLKSKELNVVTLEDLIKILQNN